MAHTFFPPVPSLRKSKKIAQRTGYHHHTRLLPGPPAVASCFSLVTRLQPLFIACGKEESYREYPRRFGALRRISRRLLDYRTLTDLWTRALALLCEPTVSNQGDLTMASRRLSASDLFSCSYIVSPICKLWQLIFDFTGRYRMLSERWTRSMWILL